MKQIRKVDLVTQDKGNCGQTCLAMLTGRTIEEIENIVGRKEGISLEGLKLACLLFGIKVIGQWTNKPWDTHFGSTREYPPTCLLHVKRYNSKDTHAMVCAGNTIYDPNGKKYYGFPDEEYSFLAYLEIESETGWEPYTEIRNGEIISGKRGCTIIETDTLRVGELIEKHSITKA